VIGITSRLASIHVTTKVSSSHVQPVGQKARALAADASRAATHISSSRGGEGVAILLAAQHLDISGKGICEQEHYIRRHVLKATNIWIVVCWAVTQCYLTVVTNVPLGRTIQWSVAGFSQRFAPRKYKRELRCTKWHSGRFLSEFFGFPLALRKFFSEFFGFPVALKKFSLRFLRLSPGTQEVFSQNSSAFPWHSRSFLSDFFGFPLALRKISLRILRFCPGTQEVFLRILRLSPGTQEVFSQISSAFPWHSGSFFSEFSGFPLALRKFSLRVLRLSPGTQEVFSQNSSAFP
jgi:uncharacterized membrane protein YccF (DUF307 family)